MRAIIAQVMFGMGSALTCLAQTMPRAPTLPLAHDGDRSAALSFEGYLKSRGDTLFVLSFRNEKGMLSASAWLKLGQTFAGHVLSAYDPQHEILSVKNPAGQLLRLPLVNSKTLEANQGIQEKALERAMMFVDDTRQTIRKQFDMPVEFTVDLDGSMMPPAMRERFRVQREEVEKKGGYLVGVCVEGDWVFSTYRGQHARLIPTSLNDENRRKVEAAYALIYAEAMARSTARKKRQKDTVVQ
jgi:hypothetical protein